MMLRPNGVSEYRVRGGFWGNDFPADQPCRLTVSDTDGHRVSASGPVPEPARSRSLNPEDVKARLSKTGGTAFRSTETAVTLAPDLFLPASEINALRRDGLERLTALRTAIRQEVDAVQPQEDASNGGQS